MKRRTRIMNQRRTESFGDQMQQAVKKANQGLKVDSTQESSQISQIFTGWANYVLSRFNALDAKTKALSESRIVHCDACEMRTGKTCDPTKTGEHVVTGQQTRGCGCNIAAKTMSPASKCPLGKW